MKIFEIAVEIKAAGSPHLSPNDFLPYIRCSDGQLIGGYERILEYFKEQVVFVLCRRL